LTRTRDLADEKGKRTAHPSEIRVGRGRPCYGYLSQRNGRWRTVEWLELHGWQSNRIVVRRDAVTSIEEVDSRTEMVVGGVVVVVRESFVEILSLLRGDS